MSTIEKLRKRFRQKPTPNDITLNEVIRVAKSYDCVVLTGGNHQIRIAHVPSGTVIPIPCHGNTVKEAYIRELNKLFDTIQKGGNL